MFMHLVDDLVPAYLVVTIYEFMHQLLVVELYLMIHVPGLKLFIFRSYLICCLVKSCFEMHDYLVVTIRSGVSSLAYLFQVHDADSLFLRYNWPAKLILKQLLQDVYSRFIM